MLGRLGRSFVKAGTPLVNKGPGRYEARALTPLAEAFLGSVLARGPVPSQREAPHTGIESGRVRGAVQHFGNLAKTPAAPLLERHPKSISPLVKGISTTFDGPLDQDLSHHNTIHQAGNVHWWRNALTPSSEINAFLLELLSGANQGMSPSGRLNDPVEADAPRRHLSPIAEENEEEEDVHPAKQADNVAPKPVPRRPNGAVNGPDETSTSNIAHHNPGENGDGGYIDFNGGSVVATESDELPQGNNDGIGRADAAQRNYLTDEAGPGRAGVAHRDASSNDASPPAASASTPQEQVHGVGNPMYGLPELPGGAPDEASQQNDPVKAGHTPRPPLRAGAEEEKIEENDVRLAEQAANVTRTPVPPNPGGAVSGPDDGDVSGNSDYIDVAENAGPSTLPLVGSGGNNNGVNAPASAGQGDYLIVEEASRLAKSTDVAAGQDAVNGLDNPMYGLQKLLGGAPDEAPQQNRRRDNGGQAPMPGGHALTKHRSSAVDNPLYGGLGSILGGHSAYEDAYGSNGSADYDYDTGSEDGDVSPMTAPIAASSTQISASSSDEEIKIRGHFTADDASRTPLWGPIAEQRILDAEQLTALKGPTGLPLYMPEGMTYSLKKTDANNKFNAELKGKAEIEPKYISTIVNMIDNLLLQSTEAPHDVSINSTDVNFKTIALAYLKILQDEKGIEINCTLDEKLVDFTNVEVTHLEPHRTKILGQSQIKEDLDDKASSTSSPIHH